VFAAIEPVMPHVRGFADGKPVTQKFPLISVLSGAAEYGNREKQNKAGPAQSDRDAGCHEAFAFGFKVSRILGNLAEECRVGYPGTGRRLAAPFCDA